MTKFDTATLKKRAILRVIHVMRGMYEEKGSSDTCLFIEPLIPEAFVMVGESLAIGEVRRREHVVPRVALCHMCHDLIKRGESDEVIAALINRLLMIVLVTPEEQTYLDNKAYCNLKETMPVGWNPEKDDPFARLHAANIKFRLYNQINLDNEFTKF